MKRQGRVSPLLVAITHLNDLFMQDHLVTMATVKHISIYAEIFSDTWGAGLGTNSLASPAQGCTLNANVQSVVLPLCWSLVLRREMFVSEHEEHSRGASSSEQ